MEELIEWLDNLIMIVKELEGRESTSRHFITIWENDYKNLLLVKEYLTDYEKLAKDYRDVELKNKLLKIEKMELEGRYIKKRKARVVACLGGIDSPAYADKIFAQSVFRQAEIDFKDHFNISRYDLLPKKHADAALAYWMTWEPSTNTKMKIMYEDMRMKYRANRRKWGGRLWR